MDSVNEKTTSYLTVAFKDKDGNAQSPDSVTYSVFCETTNTEIRPATSITSSTTIEIELDTTDNTIQDDTNKTEVRLVTIIAVYDSTRQITREFRYELVNLREVS